MSALRSGMVCAFAASMALVLPPPAQGEEQAESKAEARESANRHAPQIEAARPVGPRRDVSDPYAPRPVSDRPGLHRTPARGTRLGTRVPRPGARGAR